MSSHKLDQIMKDEELYRYNVHRYVKQSISPASRMLGFPV